MGAETRQTRAEGGPAAPAFRVLATLAICGGMLLGSAAAVAEPATARATSLTNLLERLRAMPGFAARFEEEKQIALLEVPLRSSGRLYFVPPELLLRRVEAPTPSLLRIETDQVLFSDGTGSERFDLGANRTARVFAHTFADILAGDLDRLQKTYEIAFQPEAAEASVPAEQAAWRLELTPRDETLARAIRSMSVTGHGLVLRELVIREGSGDVSTTRFQDVEPGRRFEDEEVARLKRLPTP